jgi:hypothetical protein
MIVFVAKGRRAIQIASRIENQGAFGVDAIEFASDEVVQDGFLRSESVRAL